MKKRCQKYLLCLVKERVEREKNIVSFQLIHYSKLKFYIKGRCSNIGALNSSTYLVSLELCDVVVGLLYSERYKSRVILLIGVNYITV